MSITITVKTESGSSYDFYFTKEGELHFKKGFAFLNAGKVVTLKQPLKVGNIIDVDYVRQRDNGDYYDDIYFLRSTPITSIEVR